MNPIGERKCRVLYIDDDDRHALLVRSTVELMGDSAVQAPSGAAGVELIGEQQFDVVALSHHLPDEFGVALMNQLLATPQVTPVLRVAGPDDIHSAIASLKAGASDYLLKEMHGDLALGTLDGEVTIQRLRDARRTDHEEARGVRARADALLAEVNHRVANSLQLVATLIAMQRRAIDEGVGDPSTALANAQARITAIGQVHRRLYSSSDVSRIELSGYLRGLLEELGASLSVGGRELPIKFDGPELNVKPGTAVTIGVIVTELLMNAYKYAYPDDRTGEIRVKLIFDGTGARLVVEDDGVGKTVTSGKGLGMRIIEAMCGSLRGGCKFDASDKGFRADVTFLADVEKLGNAM